MYLTLVFLPLIGSIIAGGFGRFLGARGAASLTTFCLLITLLLSFNAFYEVALSGSPCYIHLASWIDSQLFDASWGFLFDSLTVVMLVVVTFVSFLVHLYSISYMSEDPHQPRFFSYLSLFTFFMLMLVTANNFIQLFLGWEGVGLASYLLINFWFTRLQANKAAIKAMLVNRVGDFGLALGVMAVFFCFGTVDFITVFSSVGEFSKVSWFFFQHEIHGLTLICLLFLVGAVGKSAQIGLHTWLPDAMEGPTPVSALIHAATMVTAGVFLLARCSPLFEYAPQALLVTTIVGAMTSFFAATTGIVQNDLKRVIAYSTCSQLGYMVFSCGLSQYHVGVFHLMNHAFFKALLFLSAGAVIHAMSDEQDMRKMGGILQLVPFTYAMMLIGSLALVGFPFLTGFYSKDVILELAYAHPTIQGHFAFWLGSLSVICTSYYSFRLLFLTFLAPTNASRQNIQHSHDAPFLMAIPLLFLAFGSIFVGYLARDMMIGLGTSFWGAALFVLPKNVLILESEFGFSVLIKFLPLIFTLFGVFLAYFFHDQFPLLGFYIKTSFIGRKLYTFFNKRWLFDRIYNEFISSPALFLGYHVTFKLLDKGVLEILGPRGIIQTISQLIRRISQLQTGFVYHYAFVMVIGMTCLMTFLGFHLLIDDIFVIDSRIYLIHLVNLFLFLFFQG